MRTRSRLVAPTLLVLIALGGASLTVAADSQIEQARGDINAALDPSAGDAG